MAINKKLLDILKKDKFKNNSQIEFETEEDVNTLFDTFETDKPSKEKELMLDAIFDGVYLVVKNCNAGAKNPYVLVCTKKYECADLIINKISAKGKEAITFKSDIAVSVSIKITKPKPTTTITKAK